MQNSGILIGIILVLTLIVGLLVYDRKEETPAERIGNAIERTVNDAADSVKEAGEEIRDEIDDHTTSR